MDIKKFRTILKESLPNNYIENDVKDELVANCDADGDKKIDFPFVEGQHITTGDNHRGYLGYRRNVTNNSTITDDGAINLMVENGTIMQHLLPGRI